MTDDVPIVPGYGRGMGYGTHHVLHLYTAEGEFDMGEFYSSAGGWPSFLYCCPRCGVTWCKGLIYTLRREGVVRNEFSDVKWLLCAVCGGDVSLLHHIKFGSRHVPSSEFLLREIDLLLPRGKENDNGT